MNFEQKPTLADLVLVGAGHANIQVMKSFAMNPIGGLRITLISDHVYAPYSGMLPGFLAGYYSFDQCHFDLPKLCQSYGMRFINEKVTRVDSKQQKIFFSERPELAYDIASINVGVEPKFLSQSVNTIIPIKPISMFIGKWQTLIRELKTKRDASLPSPTRIAVVGGGAAGVEMTFVLMQIAREQSFNIKVDLFHKRKNLVSHTDSSIHKKLMSILQSYGVAVHLNQEFSDASDFDKILLSSEAQAPAWFKNCRMELNEKGFLKVDEHLKIIDNKNLFAAGDCIHFSPNPLKKSGVYAVRQGKILAANIRKSLLNDSKLLAFRPQTRVLSLIVVGPKQAIAQRDSGSALNLLPRGFIWKVKNWIDLRFMKMFSNTLKEMPTPKVFISSKSWRSNTCGGCGSKVSGSVLTAAFKKLGLLHLNDDAALTNPPENKLLLHSMDQFRSFISDPYLFGEISVYHALSDIYAMGGKPTNILAGLSLSPASDNIQQEEIFQIMAGILKGLSRSGAQLIGGHTNEAIETALALSVHGEVAKELILAKTNLNIGDHLILTKPLGVGVILAGHMELKVSGHVYAKAVAQMRQCNADAVQVLHNFGVRNCTDVTGFGFAGHLNEMLAGNCGAQIVYSALPKLVGALELFEGGYRSSLSPKNRESLSDRLALEITDVSHPFLFDPQTSGGLLFSIAADKSEVCVNALRQAGYEEAAVIGEVTSNAGKIVIV